jgi:hypothetical protein
MPCTVPYSPEGWTNGASPAVPRTLMRSWGPSERDVNLNYGTRERRESNAGTCGRGGTPPTDCARDSARSSHRGRRPIRGRDLDRAPCRNLVEHALAPYGAVLSRSELALPGPWLLIALAVLLGLGSNYLGPSAKIHVLWNPIVILMLVTSSSMLL